MKYIVFIIGGIISIVFLPYLMGYEITHELDEITKDHSGIWYWGQGFVYFLLAMFISFVGWILFVTLKYFLYSRQ